MSSATIDKVVTVFESEQTRGRQVLQQTRKMSAWGNASTAVAPSTGGLTEIMGEELATKLEREQVEEWVEVTDPSSVLGVDDDLVHVTLSTERKVNGEQEEFVDGSLDSAIDETAQLDEDFLLALKLQAEESGPTQVVAPVATPTPDVVYDQDLALAMKLQEEERVRAVDAYQTYANQTRHQSQGKVFVRPRPLPSNLLGYAGESEQINVVDGDNVEVESDEEFGMGTTSTQASARLRKPFWATRDKTLKGQGGDKEIITKHDMDRSGRHGVVRVTKDMPPNTTTGDLDGLSGASQNSRLKLHHSVVNKLQRQVKKQSGSVKGLGTTVEKDMRQTHAKGLDQTTRLIIHRLVNSRVLDSLHGVIRTGKEATVYHAKGSGIQQDDAAGVAPGVKGQTFVHKGAKLSMDDEGNLLSESIRMKENTVREFAVKVFRTTLGGFKNRKAYVDGDHRFRSYGDLKRQNPRKIVRVWAEKEFKNLARIYHAGIPCPEPWRLHENVLLMDFVGRDGWPAPQLRECQLSKKRLEKCYIQVCLMMRALYQSCRLVHADLSEFNILYFEGQCQLIDVGQSVDLGHPESDEFLKRDCVNVNAFFSSKGATGLLSEQELNEFVICPISTNTRTEGEDSVNTGAVVGNSADINVEQDNNPVSNMISDLRAKYSWAMCNGDESVMNDFVTKVLQRRS